MMIAKQVYSQNAEERFWQVLVVIRPGKTLLEHFRIYTNAHLSLKGCRRSWLASESSTSSTSVKDEHFIHHAAVPTRSSCCLCLDRHKKDLPKALIKFCDGSVTIGLLSSKLWCYMQGGRNLKQSSQMP